MSKTETKQKQISKVKFFATLNRMNITIENVETKEIRETVLKSYHHQFILIGTVKVLLRFVCPVYSYDQKTFEISDELNGSKYKVNIGEQCTDDLTKLF